MRQWREIATCTDRSFFRNEWMHAPIEHLTKQFNNFRANAAESKREDVCAQQHHRAHFRLGQRWTDAAGVAANEIQLENADFSVWNADVRKFTKASVDAVNYGVARDDIVDDFTRRQNARSRRIRNLNRFAAISNGGNLLE